MKHTGPSAAQLTDALKLIPIPKGRQTRFLAAHCRAPGRASTAAKLARAAQYKNWRGINLQYGLLAEKLGRKLGLRHAGIDILLEGARPNSITNAQWILVMRPEFATALKRAGWIRDV